MRIAYYTPFKPLDHPRVSGVVTIARDLHDYLALRGHEPVLAATLPAEGIFRRPWRWPAALTALRAVRHCRAHCDCWLTYHTYYKAPDLLGPVFRAPDRPYFIFAGAYASKRRKRLGTWAGYHLNRRALLAADHIFSNKLADFRNLRRIVPSEKLTYIRPGIRTEWFSPEPEAGARLRGQLGLDRMPVVVTAAMFRPGVKVLGLEWVIRACGRLHQRGLPVGLLIVGDGPGRLGLEHLARAELPGRAHFLGKLEREAMKLAYSAGDVFVFPGIHEGLGMVYLEAQCCGLPVVAFDHDGAPEVVVDGRTGLITPSFDLDTFALAIERLLTTPALRHEMSAAARAHVLERHDLLRNYQVMEAIMCEVTAALRPREPGPRRAAWA